MHGLDALAIFAAGIAAGAINAVVGSGTLITFPTLIALGYPPVTANVSNNIGLVPGTVAGAWGYRRELAGQRRRIRLLAPMSTVGSIAGALLLLALPARAFEAVVPVLIGLAVILVVIQPALSRRVAHADHDEQGDEMRRIGLLPTAGVLAVGVLLAGVYGGYFGAAQGVLLIGLLGAVLGDTLQRVNALKNVLSSVVNGVAAVTFVVAAPDQVNWAVAGLIAVGSSVGGLTGAWVGRRLPAPALRGVIVAVGALAIYRLVTS